MDTRTTQYTYRNGRTVWKVTATTDGARKPTRLVLRRTLDTPKATKGRGES